MAFFAKFRMCISTTSVISMAIVLDVSMLKMMRIEFISRLKIKNILALCSMCSIILYSATHTSSTFDVHLKYLKQPVIDHAESSTCLKPSARGLEQNCATLISNSIFNFFSLPRQCVTHFKGLTRCRTNGHGYADGEVWLRTVVAMNE